MKKMVLLLFVISTLIAARLQAQTDENPAVKVLVSHSGEDILGKSLAYEVKEKLSQSKRFELVNKELECDMEIALISLDIEPDRKLGLCSAVSANFMLNPYLLRYSGSASLYIMGADRIQNIAGVIVATADEVYHAHVETYVLIRDAFIKGRAEKSRK